MILPKIEYSCGRNALLLRLFQVPFFWPLPVLCRRETSRVSEFKKKGQHYSCEGCLLVVTIQLQWLFPPSGAQEQWWAQGVDAEESLVITSVLPFPCSEARATSCDSTRGAETIKCSPNKGVSTPGSTLLPEIKKPRESLDNDSFGGQQARRAVTYSRSCTEKLLYDVRHTTSSFFTDKSAGQQHGCWEAIQTGKM